MILLALSLLVCTNSVSSDFRTAAPVRTNFRWMLLGVTVGLSVSVVCCLSIIDQSLLTGMVDRPAGLTDIIEDHFKFVYIKSSVLSAKKLSVPLVEKDPSRLLAHQLMLGRLRAVSYSFNNMLSDRITDESTKRAKQELRPLMYDINSTVDRHCAFLELASNYDSLILHLRNFEHAISQAITNSALDIREGLRSHKERLLTLLYQFKDYESLSLLPQWLQAGVGYSRGLKSLIGLMKSFKFSKPIALHNGLIDFLSDRNVDPGRDPLANALKVTDQKFDRNCWARFILLLHATECVYAVVLGPRARHLLSNRFLALDAFSKRVNTSSQLHHLIGPIALRCARDPNSSFGFKLYFQKTFDKPCVTMFVDPGSLRSLIRRSFIGCGQTNPSRLAKKLIRSFDYWRNLDETSRSFIALNRHTGGTDTFLNLVMTVHSVLVEPANLVLLENTEVPFERTADIYLKLREFITYLVELCTGSKYRHNGAVNPEPLVEPLMWSIRDILIERNRANRNSSS